MPCLTITIKTINKVWIRLRDDYSDYTGLTTIPINTPIDIVCSYPADTRGTLLFKVDNVEVGRNVIDFYTNGAASWVPYNFTTTGTKNICVEWL